MFKKIFSKTTNNGSNDKIAIDTYLKSMTDEELLEKYVKYQKALNHVYREIEKRNTNKCKSINFTNYYSTKTESKTKNVKANVKVKSKKTSTPKGKKTSTPKGKKINPDGSIKIQATVAEMKKVLTQHGISFTTKMKRDNIESLIRTNNLIRKAESV